MNRMLLRCHNCPWWHLVVLCIVICVAFPSRRAAGETRKPLPDHVPPKRSSQIHDGFGINSDLPRETIFAVEPLVVDTDVRRRFQVDSHRAV